MDKWRSVLLPFSWLYGIIITARNVCYDLGIFKTIKVHVPVISVGNITVGGTGKTPFVEYLVRYCESQNKKVSVLSRGYGRHSQGAIVIESGSANRGDAMVLGDEPYQLAKKFPGVTVIVDSKRTRGAEIAVRQGVDIILLDDGFQHRSLGRDLDIVMIDGQMSLEQTTLLPAGRRREPLSSLHRASVVAFTRSTSTTNVSSPTQTIKVEFIPKHLCQVSGRQTSELSQVKGKSCVAFCGIGTPLAFRQTLESVGIIVLEFFAFSDHHECTQDELEKIQKSFVHHKADLIITTEKDAVKLNSADVETLSEQKLYYLEIQAEVTENESQFHELLESTLRKKSS